MTATRVPRIDEGRHVLSHESAEIIGLLIAAIGLGGVALMQLLWGHISDAWKAWRKRRSETRESIKRIEESTVNSHETNLRDDVDDVRTRLDSVERTVMDMLAVSVWNLAA